MRVAIDMLGIQSGDLEEVLRLLDLLATGADAMDLERLRDDLADGSP